LLNAIGVGRAGPSTVGPAIAPVKNPNTERSHKSRTKLRAPSARTFCDGGPVRHASHGGFACGRTVSAHRWPAPAFINCVKLCAGVLDYPDIGHPIRPCNCAVAEMIFSPSFK